MDPRRHLSLPSRAPLSRPSAMRLDTADTSQAPPASGGASLWNASLDAEAASQLLPAEVMLSLSHGSSYLVSVLATSHAGLQTVASAGVVTVGTSNIAATAPLAIMSH